MKVKDVLRAALVVAKDNNPTGNDEGIIVKIDHLIDQLSETINAELHITIAATAPTVPDDNQEG